MTSQGSFGHRPRIRDGFMRALDSVDMDEVQITSLCPFGHNPPNPDHCMGCAVLRDPRMRYVVED